MNDQNSMKIKELIRDHWQALVTVFCGVAVFCLWLLKWPFLMLAREQMQLFLWNTDYLTERLLVPGGLSQYLGEFIVQFFLNPVYGACWYALLFIAIQQLTWLLFKTNQKTKTTVMYLLSFVPAVCFCYLWTDMYIPMSLTIGFLLILLLLNILKHFRMMIKMIGLVLLIPVGYWLVGDNIRWKGDKVGTHEEMEYDMLIRQQRWETMIRRYQEKPSESLAIQNAVRLAAWKQQQISQQELMRGLTLSDNRALRSVSSAFVMSEVGMQMGIVNISQRSAFEAMEAIPNYNKSARALRRLVETNIITGQYDVALKYIAILEETTFYRGWARRMKPMAEHPEKIKDYPLYHRLKALYDQGEDVFFF